MPNLLSPGQILELKTQILKGDLCGVYAYLTSHGYSYAGWAPGMAKIRYLSGAPVMGIGLIDCANLGAERLLAIKADMAWQYLNDLERYERNAGPESTAVTRADITAEEAERLHASVLGKHTLSIENWSQFAPFRLIRKLHNDVVLEAYWNYVRDENAQGDRHADMANLLTMRFMHEQAMLADFSIRSCAQNWLYRLPGISMASQIDTALHDTLKSATPPMLDAYRKISSLLGMNTGLSD